MAVKEFGSASHATYATVDTMELVFGGVIIKEDTVHACVFPKADSTNVTCGTAWLSCVAQSANKLFHQFPVKFMPLFWILQGARRLRSFSKGIGTIAEDCGRHTHWLILRFGFIVAVSAPEHLPTAGRNQFAPATVVVTTTVAFLSCCSCRSLILLHSFLLHNSLCCGC